MKFVAIDFETANLDDRSICAVGLAVFEDGKLVESYYSLIRPPKGSGWFREDWKTNCHGIGHLDVLHSPEFPAIAPEIFSRLTAADVVIAHNAQFDMRMLRGTAKHFDLEIPAFEYLCTYRMAERVWPQLENHQLPTVAAHIGHTFEHHQAGEDAETCGRILLAMMREKGVTAPRELAEKAGIKPVSMALRDSGVNEL